MVADLLVSLIMLLLSQNSEFNVEDAILVGIEIFFKIKTDPIPFGTDACVYET